ncbi:hypothetical protein CVU82_03860 [Candidatus Falkowbacteria bacterium HGW-Falkowbacteria-1]|jgi:very-short-patch-repair endonuclease|uniref:DUF2726 domain-containing protein n=1 Tax=Candidatus Falkowbacteria bacterium HGW-Falkowbacteria-1 TaxID=2013768 RepID=A0A2N2E8X6_9BACT|nr:MAG: hypothetical protein CVU82_03860 [Candidatus Falkowbacteria bacterium HGW-Falkowbacteria-1]
MDIEKVSILMKNLSKESDTKKETDIEGTKQDKSGYVSEEVVEIESQSYDKREYFFSVAELKFFEILKEIIGDNYYIFPKVRICDIVNSKEKRNYSQFNRIKSKHVDFLICTKSPIKSKIVVELDDSSHNYQSRIERDKFVDEVFASAGIPIVHVKVKSFYDKEALIKELQKAYKTKYILVKKNKLSQDKGAIFKGAEGCSFMFVLILFISFFIFFV